MRETDTALDDIAAILRALGLGDHARPISAHEAVQTEIVPAIRELTRAFLALSAPADDGDLVCITAPATTTRRCAQSISVPRATFDALIVRYRDWCERGVLPPSFRATPTPSEEPTR